jgi:hypothetical protein
MKYIRNVFMKSIVFILLFFITCCFGTVAFAQDKPNRKQTVATEEVVTLEINVINNKLTWKNAPVGKRIEIFTILGNKVRQIEIKSPDGELELNLPRAIYILKLDDGAVKKFIIR